MARPLSVAATAAAALALILVPALPSGAAPGNTTVVNGGFEDDPVGSTTLTGWTVLNQKIDLGVTEIAGCTTVDTSDYTTLRGWDDNAYPTLGYTDWDAPIDGLDYVYPVLDAPGGAPITIDGMPLVYDDDDSYDYALLDTGTNTVIPMSDWTEPQTAAYDALLVTPDPAERADDYALDLLDYEEYSVEVVDAADPDLDLGRDGKVVKLYSDLDSDAEGYVVHGPAIVSDPFTVGAGRQINLDWRAVAESDDYHVFGYLLNTATCAQTEVLDSTGEEQDWTTTSVAIPAAGTYRFVFVSGTYDQSWGGAAGAVLYVDNIVQTKVTSGTEIDLDLQAGLGDLAAGATVMISGSGLKPSSPYTLTLHSSPIVLYTGTASPTGTFVNPVTLPTGIEPGPHKLVLTGIAPDGSTLTKTMYLTILPDGTIGYISATGPEQMLAESGSELAPLAIGGTLALLLGGAALVVARHRRRAAQG